MATKLDLDDALIREAQELGCHKTKKDAVNAALQEYVKKRRQLKILDLFGKVEYVEGFDHRSLRGKA
jgi:Arc/MetJ family transcription regulator